MVYSSYSNAGLSSVPAPERVHNPNLVFVSNISFDCTAAQLQDFFSRVGAVEHCEIVCRTHINVSSSLEFYINRSIKSMLGFYSCVALVLHQKERDGVSKGVGYVPFVYNVTIHEP